MNAQQLRQIDYEHLPISDYSRQYILRMLPNIDYYIDIYNRCLDRLFVILGKGPQDITLVDYGGGHGFLSCLAKSRGVGRVIYIDFNPKAVEAATVISTQLGLKPNMLLLGDASSLLHQLKAEGVTPDAILGMDVIEHIYRLENFFADLHALNPGMTMLFTTGSTPYNQRVKKRLQQVMVMDELGRGDQPGFFELRRKAIAQHFPQMTSPELDIWAEQTRGLNYQDTLLAVETHQPNKMEDPYNTCDPETGSWTERILHLQAYQDILTPYRWEVKVHNGFYNTHRGGVKALPSRLLNILLRIDSCHRLAPFILLEVTPKSK